MLNGRSEGETQMKKNWNRLFAPAHGTSLLLVVLASLLLCIVLSADEHNVLGYLTYLFSTYALVIAVRELILLVRAVRAAFRESRLHHALRKSRMVAQYMEDPLVRTRWSLYFGTPVNLAYAFIKIGSGLVYRSEWLISFGVYYAVLTGIRLSLAFYIRRHSAGENLLEEYRLYRLIGILLNVMNLALCALVIRMIRNGDANTYPGVLIYAMAAYTFYAVILAIANVIRIRRQGSPVYTAVKVVNLTAAIAAMLSLTAAMLYRFGEDTLFRFRMLSTVGFAAFLIIFALSFCLILNATRHIASLKSRPRP